MNMKKFLTILLLLPLLVGCKQEDTLLSERDKIEKYLTSTRHMVAEEEVGNVIENEPAFYSVFGRYAYRHIVNYYEAGREDKPIVEWGNKVELQFFNAYTFEGVEPTTNALYWSNIPEVIAEVGDKSGNTLDWPTEPLTVQFGTTKMLEGLERALPGCHEADSVQIYMTSSLAYGDNLIGVVPKNTMIAWYIRIGKITK